MNCKKYKGIMAITVLLTVLLTFCGCNTLKQKEMDEIESKEAAVSAETGDMFTDRDKEIGFDESTAVEISLSDGASQCSSDLVSISGDTITITGEGTYILSGELGNGQIIVDAQQTDKLQLVLDNVSVNCATSAAIYVRQADKVFITLAADSENTLSNSDEFIAIDDNNIDSVIFSKDDLTLNGRGVLTVTACYGQGIVSKDDLVFTSGTYFITAEAHAISGKDSVRIADGSYTLKSEKDGIHAENTDDTSLGFIYIAGGSFNIECGGDGMDSSTSLQIEAGEINITAGGGSINAEAHQESLGLAHFSDADTSDTGTVSMKGIKATGDLTINGGTIEIDSADDAIHSNSDIMFNNADCNLKTGDDGMHADSNVTINSGSVIIQESYEGIEGQTIDINGGSISIISSDDGLNAGGGNDESGFGGMREDAFASDSSFYIKISGGAIYINADGDGIDSNGNLYVSGGETYVDGPSDGANGALDYAGEAQISGGIFAAVGSSGMAMNFGEDSSQGAMLVNISAGQISGEFVLKDSSGAEIIAYEPAKSYNSIVISSPEIKQGESYTLTAGSETVTIEMSSLIYGSEGGFGGGFGGQRGDGGFGGQPGDGGFRGQRGDEDFGAAPGDGGFEGLPDESGFAGKPDGGFEELPDESRFGEKPGASFEGTPEEDRPDI